MGRELKLWIGAAVLTVVLALVGTGVAVATLVVGNGDYADQRCPR